MAGRQPGSIMNKIYYEISEICHVFLLGEQYKYNCMTQRDLQSPDC